eukprot:1654660-Amphidinium_carterae.1
MKCSAAQRELKCEVDERPTVRDRMPLLSSLTKLPLCRSSLAAPITWYGTRIPEPRARQRSKLVSAFILLRACVADCKFGAETSRAAADA